MHELTKNFDARQVLIGLVIVAVVLVGAMYIIDRAGEQPDGGQYQAVFLTNGQVYFGKLSGLGGDYVTLKDVYVVQSQDNVTQTNPSPEPESRLTLSRLDQNKLIHPEQEMTIAKTSLLFWENMQDDAEVVKKIDELKKEGK